MTKIVVNADDFGLSKGTNYGIIEAHKNGVLTSTTLMVTMPAAKHAAKLMQDVPDLGVGLHINISLGKPLTDGLSIIDASNTLVKPQFLEDKPPYDTQDVYNEIKAQYDLFLELTGQKPTHFDTHLFTSDKITSVQEAVIQLANEVKLPVRNLETKYFERVEFITFRKYGDDVGLEYLFDRYDDFTQYEYIEIMSHPGYLDQFILENSSYNTERLTELDILTSNKLIQLLNDGKNRLVSYAEIKKEITK